MLSVFIWSLQLLHNSYLQTQGYVSQLAQPGLDKYKTCCKGIARNWVMHSVLIRFT